MKEDQCTEFKACDGNCECGDNGCPDDTPPVPPGSACSGPVVYEPDHIHWICLIDGFNPSPYSPTTDSMPPGTVCTTVQK